MAIQIDAAINPGNSGEKGPNPIYIWMWNTILIHFPYYWPGFAKIMHPYLQEGLLYKGMWSRALLFKIYLMRTISG